MTLQPVYMVGMVLMVALTGCVAIKDTYPAKVDEHLIKEFTAFADSFDTSIIKDAEERQIVSDAITGVGILFELTSAEYIDSDEFSKQLALVKVQLEQVRGIYIRHRSSLPADTQRIYDKWAIALAARIIAINDATPTSSLAQLAAAANSIKQLIEVINNVR